MNLKITKKDWIFLSFVHVFKSDARVKRTRLNVCTTTTSSTSSSSKGPRRSLVAHENRRGFSPRAVARVFSSSSSIGCFCVLFVQTFARKGTRLLSCGVPEGPALGARRTKSRYPARALSQSYDFGARGGGNVRTV